MAVFYILGDKETECEGSIASVGYGEDLAFYAIAGDYDEPTHAVKKKSSLHYPDLLRIVEKKASLHFPGLLDTRKSWLRIIKAPLNEVVIPDHIFNQALRRLPGRKIGEKEIPAEIAVPLEIELAPIVSFGNEESEIEYRGILKKRTLLCKREVCALEKCSSTDAVFVELNGEPFWKFVPGGNRKKAQFAPARIAQVQPLIEIPVRV